MSLPSYLKVEYTDLPKSILHSVYVIGEDCWFCGKFNEPKKASWLGFVGGKTFFMSFCGDTCLNLHILRKISS